MTATFKSRMKRVERIWKHYNRDLFAQLPANVAEFPRLDRRWPREILALEMVPVLGEDLRELQPPQSVALDVVKPPHVSKDGRAIFARYKAKHPAAVRDLRLHVRLTMRTMKGEVVTPARTDQDAPGRRRELALQPLNLDFNRGQAILRLRVADIQRWLELSPADRQLVNDGLEGGCFWDPRFVSIKLISMPPRVPSKERKKLVDALTRIARGDKGFKLPKQAAAISEIGGLASLAPIEDRLRAQLVVGDPEVGSLLMDALLTGGECRSYQLASTDIIEQAAADARNKALGDLSMTFPAVLRYFFSTVAKRGQLALWHVLKGVEEPGGVGDEVGLKGTGSSDDLPLQGQIKQPLQALLDLEEENLLETEILRGLARTAALQGPAKPLPRTP